jgi:hypothetical protein
MKSDSFCSGVSWAKQPLEIENNNIATTISLFIRPPRKQRVPPL